MITSKCLNCDIEFKSKKSAKRKFCSKKCEGLYRTGKSAVWNIKTKLKVICANCNKEEYVNESRYKKYTTCSVKCLGEYNSKRYSENITKICCICDKSFKTKKSHLDRRKYCSKLCQALAYKERYCGTHNPNYRHRTVDDDNYKVDTRSGKSIAIHIAVVYEHLNITSHKGYSIHHRDCNKHNNELSNLVLLNRNDHMWIHKQYGGATLWAYCNNKVSKESLIEWSDDKERAIRLLDLTVLKQNSAVLKLDEFRESPEMDNLEPSSEKDIKVSEKVQRIDSDQSKE